MFWLNGHARAFTLIELLVVVAIIAILAAIATSNFLEAQVRSKVATVFSDHRMIAGALAAYKIDQKSYPEDYAEYRIGAGYGMGRLTSPIAYVAAIPLDAFGGYIDQENGKHIISYTLGTAPDPRASRWLLSSAGPNGVDETSPAFDYPGYSPDLFDRTTGPFRYMRYDPTNGTVSVGDIIRVSDAQVDDVN